MMRSILIFITATSLFSCSNKVMAPAGLKASSDSVRLKAVPTPTAGSGLFVFTLPSNIDPASVTGYLLNLADDKQPKIEPSFNSQYFINGIPPGKYDAFVFGQVKPSAATLTDAPKQGFRITAIEIKDNEKNERTEKIYLYDLGILKGSATSQNDKDFSNISVCIEGTPLCTNTAADGSYQLKDVPVGLHSVVVQKSGFWKTLLTRVASDTGKTVEMKPAALASLKDNPDGAILIEGGSNLASSRRVWLSLAAPSNVKQMMISDKADFTGATWEDFSSIGTIGYSTPGKQNVYLKFKKVDGTESKVFSGEVLIDLFASDGAAFQPVFDVPGVAPALGAFTVTNIKVPPNAIKMKVDLEENFDKAEWIDPLKEKKLADFPKERASCEKTWKIKIQFKEKDEFKSPIGFREAKVLCWQPLSNEGAPQARVQHSLIWGGNNLIVFGGSGSGTISLGGIYDTTTNKWSALPTAGTPPTSRFDHSAVWAAGKMIIFGGIYNGTKLNDGAIYDSSTNSWSTLQMTGAPSPRAAHAAVWTGNNMLVFGGLLDASHLYNNLYSFHPATGWTALTPVGTLPPARYGAIAAWTGSKLLLTGGVGAGNTLLNDTWTYDPATNAWQNLQSPSGAQRSGANGALMKEKLLIWGGCNGFCTTDDEYRADGLLYDVAAEKWDLPPLPLPYTNASFAAASNDTTIAIWGGKSAGNPTNSGYIYVPIE